LAYFSYRHKSELEKFVEVVPVPFSFPLLLGSHCVCISGRVLGVVLWSICMDVCMDLRWCRWGWKEIFCGAVGVHRRWDWFCLGFAVVSWPVAGVVGVIWRIVGLAVGHSAGGGGAVSEGR
jgi:hypothetical protein